MGTTTTTNRRASKRHIRIVQKIVLGVLGKRDSSVYFVHLVKGSVILDSIEEDEHNSNDCYSYVYIRDCVACPRINGVVYSRERIRLVEPMDTQAGAAMLHSVEENKKCVYSTMGPTKTGLEQ